MDSRSCASGGRRPYRHRCSSPRRSFWLVHVCTRLEREPLDERRHRLVTRWSRDAGKHRLHRLALHRRQCVELLLAVAHPLAHHHQRLLHDVRENLRELLLVWPWKLHEADPALFGDGEDSIWQHGVMVHVEVDPCPEPLRETDRAGLRPCLTELLRPPPLPAKHLAQEERHRISGQRGVAGQQQPELSWIREHPLTIGCPRQHPVHKMGRGVVHPPATATRAEPTPATTERHQHLVAAALALHAAKALRQDAARNVATEFLLYVPGQPRTLDTHLSRRNKALLIEPRS